MRCTKYDHFVLRGTSSPLGGQGKMLIACRGVVSRFRCPLAGRADPDLLIQSSGGARNAEHEKKPWGLPLKFWRPFRKSNSPCSALNQQHLSRKRIHSFVGLTGPSDTANFGRQVTASKEAAHQGGRK